MTLTNKNNYICYLFLFNIGVCDIVINQKTGEAWPSNNISERGYKHLLLKICH